MHGRQESRFEGHIERVQHTSRYVFTFKLLLLQQGGCTTYNVTRPLFGTPLLNAHELPLHSICRMLHDADRGTAVLWRLQLKYRRELWKKNRAHSLPVRYCCKMDWCTSLCLREPPARQPLWYSITRRRCCRSFPFLCPLCVFGRLRIPRLGTQAGQW